MAQESTSFAGLSAPQRSMRAVGDAQEALAHRQARRMGMNTTDMRTLRLLDVHGPLGASALARLLDLRPASVTTVIDRLEAAGLVERVRTADDRRRLSVRALPAARELSYAVWEPVVRAMDAVGHELSADEQRVVCGYLDRLVEVIEADAASETRPPTG